MAIIWRQDGDKNKSRDGERVDSLDWMNLLLGEMAEHCLGREGTGRIKVQSMEVPIVSTHPLKACKQYFVPTSTCTYSVECRCLMYFACTLVSILHT